MIQEAGNVALQSPLGEVGCLGMDVAGDVYPGEASGPEISGPAGQPAVFPLRVVFVVQPDLHSLDRSAFIAVGDQQSAVSGDIPISAFVHIEAGNTNQIVKVGQHPCHKAPWLFADWQGAVHILRDALLRESPGQQVGLVLWGQLQVGEHIVIGIMPRGEGAGLPFRRFF